MKANEFFKKSEPGQQREIPKPSTKRFETNIKKVDPVALEAGLGVKRKRDEVEEKLSKCKITDKETKPEVKHDAKREITTSKSQQVAKAKFDKNLYSMEESDEEELPKTQVKVSPKKESTYSTAPSNLKPTNVCSQESKPFTQKQKPKGRVKKIESEEEMEIDGENKCPNSTGKADVGLKPVTRIIRKKVKKTRYYKDEDGFQCCQEYSEYEEVEETVIANSKANKMMDAIKPSYKAPSKGQSTLSNFFGKS